MSTNSKLPFLNGWKIELSKLPNYDNFKGEFTEKLDWHLLKLIYESPFLESKPEIKSNVKNLIENVLRNSGELKVKHNQRHKCGRFYADDNISLIPLSRYVKHTVFKYLGWLDIDMVKGHPSIAIEMGKLVGLSLPAFENYVNNFDDIVTTLSQYYSVEGETPLGKDNIKWLFNSMIYGGGFDSWVKGVTEGDENYEPIKIRNDTTIHPIIAAFKKECVEIMDKIYKENPSLIKKVAEKKDSLHEKKCSVCSYWFQIIENHLVYAVAEHLLNCGILKPKRYGLEYDGLNIPPFKEFDKDRVIKEINELIVLTTGLNIKFKFKEYDDTSILHDIIETRRNMVIEDTVDDVTDDEDDETVDIADTKEADKIIMDSLNKAVNVVNEDDNKIYGFADYDLAKIVHHYCGGEFVCCNISDNIWYEFKNHYWVSCDNGTTLRNFISETLRAKYVAVAENLIKLKKAKPSKQIDKMLHIVGTITEKFGKTNDKNNIMRECRELFYKSDFEERLNENVHLICFTNGIFDSNSMTFRDGTPEDMCSMTTGVPLLPLTKEEEAYKCDILQRMIYDPLGEGVGDYFLLNIAFALVGKRMKRILFGLGTSDAGKSTICKATLNSFADYAYTFNAGCLAHTNSSQDEAQRMRWTLLIAKKRIIFSNEMKSNASLDGEMIKKISGGDHIIGRGHCQNEVKYLVDFLTVCMANDLPKITPYGEALSTRVRVIPYEKKYVPNPKNDMELQMVDKDILDAELNSDLFKRVFVSLVINRYIAYVDSGRVENEPVEVSQARREWTGDDGSGFNHITVFLEDFEITNDPQHFVTSKDIEDWVNRKKFGISSVAFAKELKKYCKSQHFDRIENKVKSIQGKKTQCWFGIRPFVYSPEEEHEEVELLEE